VFLENLHASRKLETTYYATDRKQLTDFFWYRESGIRVNIGLQNINVVPLYGDAQHDGDNEFVLANPNIGAEEKQRFRRLLDTHCRCPKTTVSPLGFSAPRDRSNKVRAPVSESHHTWISLQQSDLRSCNVM